VRREFLRSEATEASAISAVVTQYALAYPEVRFTMLLEGRLAIQTSGGGDLREALINLYGLDVARQLLPVESSYGEGRDEIRVRGLVSPPGLTRSSRGYIHLFVNRRAIQPRGQIALVLEEAYHTLMMKGRHPVAALDIRVHPASVDVNVHPTKSEVKFRDTPKVMGVIGRAVREALIEGGVHPWTDAATPAPGEVAQRRFELRRMGDRWERPESGRQADQETGRREGAEIGGWEQEGRVWDEQYAEFESRSVGAPTTLSTDQSPVSSAPNLPVSKLPPLRVVGQVGQTYIIAESPDGMYLIDQHAAHERVTYERLMARRAAVGFDHQNLLIPQAIELPPAAHGLLLSNADVLAEWGFTIEDFGTRLKVRSVPAGLHESSLGTALLEVADHLNGRGGSTPDDWREAMLTTLACHSSIRAGQTLSLEEMRELLIQLERCNAPRTCPHGRPTMILLTTTQLERQFGRIK
jgi:DNA mismatch repair protein MutL